LANRARQPDPREIAAAIATLRDIDAESVARNADQLSPREGEEVSACFGGPVLDETDAQRVLRCALDIQKL